mgnify:FL=1
MKIKKRPFIRIISFLCAAVLAAGGFALTEHNNKVYLRQQITNEYKQSLTEFSSLISEINFGLKKQLYSSSPTMLSNLSTDIYKNSAAAKECLERLPISEKSTENIYKFLATTGDFSKAVSASNTDEVTEKNKKQLKKLIDFSDKLTDEITATASMLEDNDLLSEDVDNAMNKLDIATTFSSSAEDIGEIAKNIPTLIYDGPFSDHVNKKEAELLKGANSFSKEDAMKKAEVYLNERNLKYTCDENSATESYIFEGNGSVCAVTKKGGYCLYMNKLKSVNKTKIKPKTAISNAKAYLKDVLGLDFKESYYIINENIITINMAYFENNIIYYPDLIKVGVRLDNGDITSVEARGFIMSHHKREVNEFSNSVEQAKKVVANQLKVVGSSKALISNDALDEKYCYEFKCKTEENEDVIVYINEKSLVEENIFIIIHTEGGTLTK